MSKMPPSHIMPKYSLIIATYNRLEEVKELLVSAEKMDFPRADFELLFSDDGSTDGTPDFLAAYRSPSGLQIQWIRQQNQGPGAARNHGMSKALGQYFIFIDSDCMFPPQYLQEVDRAVEQHGWDAFGGPDTCHPDFPPLLKAINYSMTSFLGTGGTRGSKKAVTKFYPRSFNMGIHRGIFEKIGGMGSLRHGQDMEFSARIYRHGYKVGLIPDAFVYHKRRTSLRRFFKQIFNWGVARVNLSRMDKQLLKPVHFLPMLILLGFAMVLLLAPFWWVGRILLGVAVAGLLGISLLAFLQSFAMYKNLHVAELSVITLLTQVFAYGAGMLSGWVQVLRKGSAKGFTKDYYK